MTFTIEQLEALKEGTTPGPWEWHNNVYDPDERFLHSHNGSMCLSVDDVGSSYFEGDPVLMSASPALLDQLIAEKKAHQRIRRELQELREFLRRETAILDDVGMSPSAVQLGTYAVSQLNRIFEGNG